MTTFRAVHVAEAAVIGLKPPELGEEVGAAVVLKPGATAELPDFVKSRGSRRTNIPHIWRVPSLPKGSTGKIPAARSVAAT